MKWILFFLLVGWTTSCFNPDESTSSQSYFDNVLLIISDDLATHALSCYGNPLVETPVIDRLASEGIRFTKAYANAPMCTPSRATILTGKYPHAAGVTLLFTPLADSVYTLSEHLKKYNFATGIFGKTHFLSNLKHGFDTIVVNQHHQAYLANLEEEVNPDNIPARPPWKPFQDHARIWLNAEGKSEGIVFEHSRGTFFAKETIKFLNQNRGNRFFAVCSFNEPHSPFNFSTEFYQKVNREVLELPVFGEEDIRWIPEVFADLTDEEKIGIIQSYYQSVEYMDRNVGLLIDHLEKENLMDNTLIILIGDHGYLLNHHGRFEKHMMWEEAVLTPLIIRGYDQNRVIETPVELADLVPTIQQALGVPAMEEIHGYPLQAIIRDEETEKKHDFIFSEYLTDNKAMVCDGRWKYIYSSGEKDLGSGYATGIPVEGPVERLYDLQNDPREQHNIAAENNQRVSMMREMMLRRFKETHPRAIEINDKLPKLEQLRLFCQPPEGEKDYR